MSVLEEFQQLWHATDDSPDVFAFLVAHRQIDVEERRAILLFDQQQRWTSTEPLRVEDYAANIQDLCIETKLALALGEFSSLKRTNGMPEISQFASRFPDLSDRLLESLTQSDSQATLASHPKGMTNGQTSDLSEACGTDKQVGIKTEADLTRSYVTDAKVGDHHRGRYRLVRTLGRGGYGVVYLAIDEDLRRNVAVKVPATSRFRSRLDTDSYLTEAQLVAGLDHPNIVPVYDVGRTDDGSIYVVSKFIDGCTMTDLIGTGLSMEDIAERLIAPIAIALDYAHQRRLIHRDVKPSNILIEHESRTPFLADFGLAVRVEDNLSDGQIAGTPAYMSPEAARGEGHRLDGRSDVFSLGTVLYELMTGKKPFRGSTKNEIYHQVISVEPVSPREINESIPPELERICLKAMSKRSTDRYARASHFADDLLHWRDELSSGKQKAQVVPRGLRSFDANDADFFIDLLPGPRDRNGLPDSIQFWKTRIESSDPESSFSVGLVCGASGSGKSSLVKAGLIPRLRPDIVTIYIEATPDETEMRILRGLGKSVPDLPRGLTLVDAFAWLRQDEEIHVLIVLDQFEQWLHTHRIDLNTDLVRALRQCDGVGLKALVMVRDDFAMPAARFMDKIEVPIVQGKNFATVDLFDEDHAEQVLLKFGQAFGKLPSHASRLAAEEKVFVKKVAAGLAVDGKVVPVRLALFAEMIKNKPWLLQTLDSVGGTHGLGVNFLEETFRSQSANPRHRQLEPPARKVLQALLPAIGTDIKGNMRSHDELALICGYQGQSTSFNELIRILDGELRLITPTDPEGFRTESGSGVNDKYYQLTHDYLVQALRNWLQQKQLETRRGRAEIRLSQRSAMWNAKPESRQLPSTVEFLQIITLTRRENWSHAEQLMMATARRIYGMRLVLVSAIFLSLAVGSMLTARTINDSRDRAQVDGLIDQLLVAKNADVPKIAAQLDDLSPDRLVRLNAIATNEQSLALDRLRARYVLAYRDDKHLGELIDATLIFDPSTVKLVRDRLTPFAETATRRLWNVVDAAESTSEMRVRAAALLAVADPTGDGWSTLSPRLISALIAAQSIDRDSWVELLQPVAESLTHHWKEIFLNPVAVRSDRVVAAGVLSRYADGDLYSEMLLNAEPSQFPMLVHDIRKHEHAIVAAMRRFVRANEAENQFGPNRERMLLNAILTLLHLGQLDDSLTMLKASADPTMRTRFIIEVRDYGIDPDVLLSAAAQLSVPDVRQAVLLALGTYLPQEISADTKRQGFDLLENLLRQSRFASERSAAEFLARRWENQPRINDIHSELATPVTAISDRLRDRDWWVNSKSQVMCVINPPFEFTAGSPVGEFMRENIEAQVGVTIPYRFAVAAHELSINDYQQFRSIPDLSFKNSADTNLPANKISLVQAMQYCRWLSEEEGISEDQMCFPAVDEIKIEDAFLTEEKLRRIGYRLPTEQEWEGVCRASSTTAWFTGNDPKALNQFAWAYPESADYPNSIGSLMPNAWGFFDLAGNMLEWCHPSQGRHDFAQRGGNFKQSANNFRSARRYSQTGERYSYNGFRIACTLPPLD